MRPRTWKLLGLAGIAGVAATGVVVARNRREQHDYDPDELRAKLHSRLAEVPHERAVGGGDGGDAPPVDAPPRDAPPPEA